MSVLSYIIAEIDNFLVEKSLIPMLNEVNFPIFLYTESGTPKGIWI